MTLRLIDPNRRIAIGRSIILETPITRFGNSIPKATAWMIILKVIPPTYGSASLHQATWRHVIVDVPLRTAPHAVIQAACYLVHKIFPRTFRGAKEGITRLAVQLLGGA